MRHAVEGRLCTSYLSKLPVENCSIMDRVKRDVLLRVRGGNIASPNAAIQIVVVAKRIIVIPRRTDLS